MGTNDPRPTLGPFLISFNFPTEGGLGSLNSEVNFAAMRCSPELQNHESRRHIHRFGL